MENNNTLNDKWKNFLNVVLDPWVVILLLATIFFIFYSNSSETTNKNIISILTLIISFFSAILGGVLANRWAQMTEEKILVARGKSAIRSLKLILLNISKIEKRTKYYITSFDAANMDFKLVVSNLEEVIEKCNILEEEIISSIENWTDIIPEVENLKTQIGVITEMKLKEAQLESDVSILNNSLVTEKKLGEAQKREMQTNIIETERELVEMKKKLINAESKLNNTVLSGLTSSSPYNTINPNKMFYSGSDFLESNGKLSGYFGQSPAVASGEQSFLGSKPVNNTNIFNSSEKGNEKKIFVKVPKK